MQVMRAYKGLTRYCWAEKAPTHFVMQYKSYVPGLGQLFDLGHEVSITHTTTQYCSTGSLWSIRPLKHIVFLPDSFVAVWLQHACPVPLMKLSLYSAAIPLPNIEPYGDQFCDHGNYLFLHGLG